MTTIGSAPADTQRAPTPTGFSWLPGALVAFAVAVVAVVALFMVFSDNPDTSRTAARG